MYAGYCSGDWTAWHLAAFDAATGADRWSLTIETSGNCAVAGPAVADGVAYVVVMTGDGADTDGYLAAFDAATGAERWRWAFDPGGLAVRPVVHAGAVYVVGVATLHAVDAAGGAERWHFDAGGLPLAGGRRRWHGLRLRRVRPERRRGRRGRPLRARRRDRGGTLAFPDHGPAVHVRADLSGRCRRRGERLRRGRRDDLAVDAASGAERWRARLALALPASTPEADVSPAAGS